MSQNDPVREELGKIDFHLDQLARAVERGQVPMSSWEALAPGHLSRRAELVEALAGRSSASAPAIAPVPGSSEVRLPVAGGASGTPPTAERGTALPGADAARARRSVPWPTVLTFLGAFLVIVASAIFAIAAWGDLGVVAKLGFLVTLTIGFYVWSEVVAKRLRSRSGAIALALVSGAMLVFDGWIAIDGLGLEGPVPWALLALVCSIAYSAMELRLAGRVIGVLGAAAQVAWWWLLAHALDLPDLWALAVIALVAGAWELTARRAPADGPLAPLVRVLRWAAPIVSLLVAAAAVPLASATAPGLSDVAACAVVAAAAALVFDRRGRLGRVGALGSAPVIVAVLVADADRVGPFALPLLIVLAAAYAIWELRVGTWAYGAIGLLFEMLAVSRIAETLDWPLADLLAVFGLLGLSWVAASALLSGERARRREEGLPGVVTMRALAEWAGWLLLAVSTLSLLGGGGAGTVLSGAPSTLADVARGAWFTVAWLAAVRLRHRPWPGAAVIASSAFTALMAMRLIAPDASPTWMAAVVVAVLVAWAQAPGAAVSLLRLNEGLFTWGLWAGGLIVPLLGLVSSSAEAPGQTWAPAVLLSVSALFWALESRRRPEWPAGALTAAALAGAAAAAGAAGGLEWLTASRAGAVAAVALAGCAPLAARSFGPGGRTSVRAWAYGAAIAGSIAFADASSLSGAWLAAGVLAAAWTVAVSVTGDRGAAVVPALWVLVCGVSVGRALDSGVVLGLWMIAAAYLLAAPSFVMRRAGSDHGVRTVAGSLVPAAALGLLLACGLAFASWVADVPAPWLSMPREGLVVALALTGGWVAACSWAWAFEPGYYAGLGLITLAVPVQLDLSAVATVEYSTLALGAYVIGMGFLYARLGDERRVPMGTDVAGMALIVGVPALLSAVTGGADAAAHAWWAVGLGLAAIGVGIRLRCRAYFFAGVAGLVWTALFRSWDYVVAHWWIVLGVTGVVLLVVALLWERRRLILDGTRRAFGATVDGWR